MSVVAPLEANHEEWHSGIPIPLPQKLNSSGIVKCLIALKPLIAGARDHLRRGIQNLVQSYERVPFDPASIEESLATNLAEPLTQMTARVMVLELNVARLEGSLVGDTAEERFASFLNRLEDPEIASALLREYPVMTEQIVAHLDRWAASSLRFLENFCEDWESLCESFFAVDPGPLVAVQGGAGDTHRNGSSVMILTFGAGGRVVYKPRSLAVDRHFQELLEWLNERGAEPALRLPRILGRAAHGWCEFIEGAPCLDSEEVARFYQRQGAYLAILYALEASDFHCENLIADGEHPMLVDLEALFHPRAKETEPGRAGELEDAMLGQSVLRVGLLPLRMWAGDGASGVDISGLGSTAGQLTPYGVVHWEAADTDEMHLVRKRKEMPRSKNRPTLNGHEVSASDYAEAIATGFASTYRRLLACRDDLNGMLHRFSEDEVRVIARSTQTYGALFQESFHPDLLRNEADRNSIFERLHEAVTDRPSLFRVVPAEIRDLKRGDIPLFTTRPESRHLWTSTGEVIENYFEESGGALVRQRLLRLSEADLQRQLWIIRASIATLASSVERSKIRPGSMGRPSETSQANTEITPRQLIFAARVVGDRLQELAYGDDQNGGWIGLLQSDENNWSLAPLGTDLYDGLPGVILFLAYLGSVTGDRRYETLAVSALTSLRRQMKASRESIGIGGFTGWGGIIYVLAHLGFIWGQSSMFLEAESLLDPTVELIGQDKTLDVIGGAAGYVLALRNLFRRRPSARLLDIVRACGEHLLASVQPAAHGIGWLTSGFADAPLTGFAHGNAGIAYALIEVSKMLGDSRFHDAALEAFAYERSIFSPEHQNWPDLRRNATARFASAWCHGAPGIGLSRLCCLEHSKDPLLEGEIRAGMASAQAHGFGGNHSLCHGDLGNADILLCAAEVLGQSSWRARAHQAAIAVVESVLEQGWLCGNPLGVESPGLMTGIAGIGYAFLRFAEPARIPSVLSLEPPNA